MECKIYWTGYFLDEICVNPAFETDCSLQKRAEISVWLSPPYRNKAASTRLSILNATIPCSRASWYTRGTESSPGENHVLHLHPAQGLPPPRPAAAPTSACSRHSTPPSPSSAAEPPPAPPERDELRRVQAVPHRRRHWRGRGVQ